MSWIPRNRRADAAPFVAAGAMVVAGLLMHRYRPAAADLRGPRRRPGVPASARAGDVARETREAVAAVTPDNLVGGMGRTLILAGV